MHVVLCYKNFAAHAGISHIGLGVAAANTAKVLRANGMQSTVFPLVKPTDLKLVTGRHWDATHVVVSAPWIPVQTVMEFINTHPEVKLAINCHSNVGFLQADTNAVELIKNYMSIERGAFNFDLGGNSMRFCDWVKDCFQVDCKFLPNLYYLDYLSAQPRPIYRGGTLRIGMFGAIRPLKNMMTGAAAALEIARAMREPMELWVCAGRTEAGGQTVLGAIKSMYRNLPGISLREYPWAPWPTFRRMVATMHLLLQPSYSESFNMVTADGVAEGVPSVVSDAIVWAPPHWQASTDDALDVARVGRSLLTDPRAGIDGKNALVGFISQGISAWREWLA